jgi:hypothetical protein
MDSNKKARVARVLGYICLAVGTLNLILVVVGRPEMRTALLATGFSALTLGIIMVALGKKKSET